MFLLCSFLERSDSRCGCFVLGLNYEEERLEFVFVCAPFSVRMSDLESTLQSRYRETHVHIDAFDLRHDMLYVCCLVD